MRDVQFLHNEQYFAAAQKKYVYIYDKRGLEVHCLKVLDPALPRPRYACDVTCDVTSRMSRAMSRAAHGGSIHRSGTAAMACHPMPYTPITNGP